MRICFLFTNAMIFLILSIVCSTSLFILFKLANILHLRSLPVIAVNYFIAALLGLITNPAQVLKTLYAEHLMFFLIVMFIGVMFLVMFMIISISTDKTGVAVTSMASKISVVFPFSVSLFIDPDDRLTHLKLAGIILAILSITLVTLRNHCKNIPLKWLFFPILLFMGIGITDSAVKIAQHYLVSDDKVLSFSVLVFTVSFVISVIFLPFGSTHKLPAGNLKKTLAIGVLLGVVNFGSLFFLLHALNTVRADRFLDSSSIFGINNLGIVALGLLTGVLFFREKLSALNWIGFLLSIVSIILLSI